VIDKVHGNMFPMPLTQERLGEAMGVSAVHANRVVKQLREENVVDFSRGQVTILDENKLQALAGFDRRYLHQKPSF
jgi:DNA-binding transcriptional regulator LsrR (DeoR family)